MAMRGSWVLCRSTPRPQPRKFKWNGHYAQAKDSPGRKMAEFYDLSVGKSNKGPIAFTMALPKPLQDFDLNTIELQSGQIVTASNMDQQKPCAKIVPDRMGLHAHLLQVMRAKFGIKMLTPVQARVLQCMHARYDICSCAPTGSGKTFAICIGLVARLMREGPPKQGSTVFLVPTEELGYQIERWLRALWWYSEDQDPLFLTHCVSAAEVANAYRIPPSKDDTVTVGDQCFTLPNLSGNLRYPDQNPYILLSTPEVFWEWLQYHVSMSENSINKRLFPQVDTIVIDEVESVLTVDANIPDKDAPGRKVMQQLYVCKPYDAPINVVLNSATLSPTVMNHARKYLKKSVFDPATVRMFADTNTRGEYSNTPTEARKNFPRSESQASPTLMPYESLYDDAPTRTHYARMRYKIPSTVQVSFYLLTDAVGAKTEKQLALILDAVLKLLNGKMRCKKALIVTETDLAETYMIHLLQRSHMLQDTHAAIEKYGDSEQSNLPKKERSQEKENISDSLIQEQGSDVNQTNETNTQTVIVSSSRRIKGIDIPGLETAFIASSPKNAMDFVHLAGRVGRMGSSGNCVFLILPGACRKMQEYCSVLNIPFSIVNENNIFGSSE